MENEKVSLNQHGRWSFCSKTKQWGSDFLFRPKGVPDSSGQTEFNLLNTFFSLPMMHEVRHRRKNEAAAPREEVVALNSKCHGPTWGSFWQWLRCWTWAQWHRFSDAYETSYIMYKDCIIPSWKFFLNTVICTAHALLLSYISKSSDAPLTTHS